MSEETQKFDWRRFIFGGGSGLGVILFLSLLSALILIPYVWYFESRDALERPLSTLPGAGFLEGLEYSIYDSYFDLGETVPANFSKRIAIIGIDENSLAVEKQWPWPRRLHAALINKLHRAGAKVIAFDVDFSSYQNPNADGRLSKDDIQLIEAVQKAKMVVLPSQLDFGTDTVSSGAEMAGIRSGDRRNRVYRLVSPFSEEGNNPGLDEETPDLALNYQRIDSDKGVRIYPLRGRIEGNDIGSFAALTAAIYQGLSMGQEDSFYETLLKKNQWFALNKGQDDVPTRQAGRNGKDDLQLHNFLLRYRFRNMFPQYSYSSVLRDYDDSRMKRLFKDKIVFVGATAEILKDWFPAPGGDAINGVEIHAGATCQLLQDSYIEPPQMRNTIFNVFGIAFLSGLWPQLVRPRVSRFARRVQDRWNKRKRFKKSRLRVQDMVWFFLTSTLAVLPPLGFYTFCNISFHQMSTWTVGIYPMLASLLSASLAMVYLFTLENAERRKVMHQVGLYLDPDIMETILAHPEEDYPRPRRTTATVMFTDLQGFTPYTETHTAEEVVNALNAYMSRLHPIIKKHFGSVDKYIGDAIMAYFGVPVPHSDHATCAIHCAMEIQEANAQFRAETGIPFYTRIGIHTGELIAGSIGSQSESASLIAYTVIGDTVNLAARLEAKNKDFGSWVLCSRATIEAAPGVARLEPVRGTLKGISQEVEMFIVRGPLGEEARDAVWGDMVLSADDSMASHEPLRLDDFLTDGMKGTSLDEPIEKIDMTQMPEL